MCTKPLQFRRISIIFWRWASEWWDASAYKASAESERFLEKKPQNTTFYSSYSPHTSVFGSHTSVFGPHTSLFGPHTSVFGPHTSVLGPHTSVFGPTPSVIAPQTHQTYLNKHDFHDFPWTIMMFDEIRQKSPKIMCFQKRPKSFEIIPNDSGWMQNHPKHKQNN